MQHRPYSAACTLQTPRNAFWESRKRMENIRQVERLCRLTRESRPEPRELEGRTSPRLWASQHDSHACQPLFPQGTLPRLFTAESVLCFRFTVLVLDIFQPPFTLRLGPSEQIDG